MTVGIRLLGLASGDPTPHDGQWLVEYDPTRRGVHPESGRPTVAHVIVSPDPGRAQRFESPTDAHALWTAESGRPWPADRPLTAFNIAIDPIPENVA